MTAFGASLMHGTCLGSPLQSTWFKYRCSTSWYILDPDLLLYHRRGRTFLHQLVHNHTHLFKVYSRKRSRSRGRKPRFAFISRP